MGQRLAQKYGKEARVARVYAAAEFTYECIIALHTGAAAVFGGDDGRNCNVASTRLSVNQ